MIKPNGSLCAARAKIKRINQMVFATDSGNVKPM